MAREWLEIKFAPAGEVLETKIDDDKGERNHGLLKRRGQLWFVPDGSMYVYYTPTHWRRPTIEQMENLAREAETRASRALEEAASYRR